MAEFKTMAITSVLILLGFLASIYIYRTFVFEGVIVGGQVQPSPPSGQVA